MKQQKNAFEKFMTQSTKSHTDIHLSGGLLLFFHFISFQNISHTDDGRLVYNAM